MFKYAGAITAVATLVLSPAFGQTTKSDSATVPQLSEKAASTAGESRNAVLSDAASVNEDLIEFALAGEAAKVAEKVLSMRKLLPTLRPLLDNRTFEALARQTAAMEQALAKNNGLRTALAAVEAYRTIENAKDAAGRNAPVEVAMLDYSGFKLSILAAGPRPDWVAIAASAKESNEFWSALAKNVPDKSMQNLLAAIQEGLKTTVGRRDINGVKFAAKVQLEAVDVLEQYFRGTYKTPVGDHR